jgi:hypothetical protein
MFSKITGLYVFVSPESNDTEINEMHVPGPVTSGIKFQSQTCKKIALQSQHGLQMCRWAYINLRAADCGDKQSLEAV